MISSFSQYLVEEQKTAYFTFGRMNPPTIGHGKLLDKLSSAAGKNPYFVYLSQSQSEKKDPLFYSDKVKHARKMFPKHARSILINKSIKTAIDVLVDLYGKGFNNVVMVVGSDRINEFDILLNKYNNKKARHGFYNFETIKIVSAGDRDPDAEGVEGMSASKQRQNAANNDFTSFTQGLPKQMNNRDARKLFNDVRKGMGLSEQNSFKNHIALSPVSEEREEYIKGELFDLGDTVAVKESGQIGIITHLGSNYVIVEFSEDNFARKWIKDVEKVEEQCWDGYTQKGMKKKGDKVVPNCVPVKEREDSDIGDKKGSQPAKYHTGLSKSTKSKRDAHFKKGAKMDDDNPAAYKPAPGDKGSETKPSKYTKKFKQMYGEEFKRKDTAFYISESAKAAIEKKAKKTGWSYSVLKKVYDRGVAAWRTGHRPGTTPQQWGLARVNSFVTGGKTTKTADKDLHSKGKSG